MNARPPIRGSIASRMLAMGLLMAVPLWATSFGLAAHSVREERDFARLETRSVARLAATHVDAWYLNQTDDLEVLAQNHLFDHGSATQQLEILRGGTRVRPDWRAISLLDPRGVLLLSTAFPVGGKPLDLGDRSDVRSAIARHAPAISGRFTLRRIEGEAVGIAVPILRGSRLIGLLHVVNAPREIYNAFRWMRLSFDEQGEGATRNELQVIVLVEKGGIIFRSPEIPPDFLKPPGPASHGPMVGSHAVFEERGLDGVDRLFAEAVAARSGWRIFVGVPIAHFGGYRGRTALGLILINLLASLATLLLGVLLIRRVVRPIVEFSEIAARFGGGQLDVRAPALTGELGDLSRAFNQMADKIETSHHELERMVTERTAELAGANAQLQDGNARMEIANRHLAGTVEELRSLDRQRSEFINMISHDLRIPLTAISGYGEFLDEGLGGELNPQQHEYVTHLLESVQRMVGLLDQLLELARSDAGRMTLRLETVEPAQLVREAIAPLEVLASRKHQSLSIESSAQLEPVSLDPDRIQQVLSNLLSNAIKYTQEGGVITVRLGMPQGGLRVEIQDNGPGVAAEDRPHMFERFFRSSKVHQVAGTGLGLAIAKTIVEAHGGRIGLESPPEGGAMFWFELPRVPPASAK